MTNPITAASAADVLAYVPHALGFTPEESFVFLTLHGANLSATLRVDAPAAAATVDYAQAVTHYLLTDEDADGVLFIAYTNETTGGGGRPYLRHVWALEAEFNRAGLALKDSWLVTSAGWTPYTADEADGLQSLEEIQYSALSAELVFRGSNPAAKASIADPAYTGDPDAAEKITELAGQWKRINPLNFTAPAMTRARTLWQAAITSGTAPQGQDAMVLVAALHARPTRDRIMADIISTENNTEVYAAVLVGQHDQRPDWARVDAAETLTAGLLAHTPLEARAPLYTLLGWLSWYKGAGSAADAYLTKALRAEPDHRLATLLQQLLDRGVLATVATRTATAYRPGH